MIQVAARSFLSYGCVLVSGYGDKSSFKPVKCVFVGVLVWLETTMDAFICASPKLPTHVCQCNKDKKKKKRKKKNA